MPDWYAATRIVEGMAPEFEEKFHLYSEAATAWMTRIAGVLGRSYRVKDSTNFILVSSSPGETMEQELTMMEQLLDIVFQSLDGAGRSFHGKMPVVLFDDHQKFREYLAQSDQQENGGTISSVYIETWYPQIVIYAPQGTDLRHILLYEICNTMLAPLTLPAWIASALRQEIEHFAGSVPPYELSARWVAQHRAYWTPERTAAFWTGESFGSQDEGGELSKHLAQFLLRGLFQETTQEERAAFLDAASPTDGGRRAAEDVLGVSLDEALEHFLKG